MCRRFKFPHVFILKFYLNYFIYYIFSIYLKMLSLDKDWHITVSSIMYFPLATHLHNNFPYMGDSIVILLIIFMYSFDLLIKLWFLPAAIGRTLIPRYFRSIFEGGATELFYVLKHPKESFHSNFVSLDCDQCTMVTQNGKPMFTQVQLMSHCMKNVQPSLNLPLSVAGAVTLTFISLVWERFVWRAACT